MPEPLVCEDTSLTRLMETVNQTAGARILYQDTVRRGGVFGFFAREVHRVAYIGESSADDPYVIPGLTAPQPSPSGYDDDLMMLADAIAEPAASSTSVPDGLIAQLQTAIASPSAPASASAAPSPAGSFESLLAAADADELDVASGRHRADGLDFASILRRYTEPGEDEGAADQAHPIGMPSSDVRPADTVPADALLTDTVLTDAMPVDALLADALLTESRAAESSAGQSWPGAAATGLHAVDTDGLAEVTPIGGRGTQARNRLELLVQLRQVGVPVSVNPGVHTQSVYEALEEILDDLPEAAPLPDRPGQLVAIVGESGAALRAARTTARLLRQSAGAIVVAGLEEAEGLTVISGRRQAARLRRDSSEADLPTIVVVATDGSGPDDPWTVDLLDALRPDQTWAVIDARWKPEDCHGLLDQLGAAASALVVHGAELSASPASVWDLDLPLALLDDRRPTRFSWLSLLVRLFEHDIRSHRATA